MKKKKEDPEKDFKKELDVTPPLDVRRGKKALSRALVPLASADSTGSADVALLRVEDNPPPKPPGPKGLSLDEEEAARLSLLQKVEADEIAAMPESARQLAARDYANQADKDRADAIIETVQAKKQAEQDAIMGANLSLIRAAHITYRWQGRAPVRGDTTDERLKPGTFIFASGTRTDEDGHVYGGYAEREMLPLLDSTGAPLGRPPILLSSEAHAALAAEWPTLEPLLTPQEATAWRVRKIEEKTWQEAALALSVGRATVSKTQVNRLLAQVEVKRAKPPRT
jgi:predicted DNA-binding protein (UPF0251 family)